MKLVVAVIKPFKLEEVKAALEGVGVQGLTVTDARGFGRQRGHTEVYRGAEYQVELLPKTRIEVLADDDAVSDVVKAMSTVPAPARSGTARCGWWRSSRPCASAPARWEAMPSELRLR